MAAKEDRKRRRQGGGRDDIPKGKGKPAKNDKSKAKDPSRPKQVPKTLESKRIFDPDQLMDEETVLLTSLSPRC